ncbi:hypothetical protein J4E93_006629 [Alternaria ventricosa]|uniref:uncharacterized protein n=1 Tax=Alternaria ventricosa TaxID=1187951 RepID=UPI0020C45862|nr:uncharacterized protein J4E93_006629 [Alternaria ventricosa]KAI4643618.1 hypothetical protein J4E93_006629 [Alternaria ventricosa]
MASHEANTQAEPDMFQHSVLPKEDGSFRLIQIRPDLSIDGLPDCDLQNALVKNSNYVCLSYTWGRPGDECPIKLNGKLCHVRRNLYDFLQAARQRLTFCTLWIDALCINQTDVEERNHQVQQMGNIFAGASFVVSWLGNSLETQIFVQAMEQEFDDQAWKTWEEFYHSNRSRRSNSEDVEPNFSSRSAPAYNLIESAYDSKVLDSSLIQKHYHCVARNAYWKRAWVTQEIMLANALVVMAGQHVIGFLSLVHACMYTIRKIPGDSLMEYAYLFFKQQGNHPGDSPGRSFVPIGKWQDTHGLLALLQWFRGKCCALRRDRIYSLLALCKGGEKVRVDYDGSEFELIRQVLDACEDELCFCSAATVARIVQGPEFSHLEKEAYDVTVTHDFKLQAYSSDLEICPSCTQQIRRSKPGVYFCLSCETDIRRGWHGHLFWDNSPCDNVVNPSRRRDLLWLARKDMRRPRVLCRKGQGIEIKQEEVEGEIYTLRFSLGTLVDVMHLKFEDEKRVHSSHTCRG